jgi:hypothetical protein
MGIKMSNVEVSYLGTETRPAIVMDDVKEADLFRVKTQAVPGKKSITLNNVEHFSIQNSEGFSNKQLKKLTSTSF